MKTKKFTVDVVSERLQTIVIEASSAQEARELVLQGEYETNQIINVIDENAEIVGVTEKK